MKERIIKIVFAVALAFLILTVSIGLPIYLRFFYYLHIPALNLEQTSGYTYAQIKTAYDQVLNYLTLPFCKFGTGELPISEQATAHFVDCKGLFNLNITVLLISLAIVITVLILQKKGVVKSLTLGKFHASFYSGIGVIALPIIIGALASINFDKAFTIFHQIFFPGKENWIFSWYDDHIIRILPQEFFMNCAILIGCGMLIFSTTFIILGILKHKKSKHTPPVAQTPEN